MKTLIPHSLTFCNVLCGILGIVSVYEKSCLSPFYWACLAAVFDLFDGGAARLLKATSQKGKLLDTLADTVSFGVLPTVWAYVFLKKLAILDLWAYVALLFIMCAVYRLVDFSTRKESTYFLGLPTPSATLFTLSLSGLHMLYDEVLLILVVLISVAMITPIPMFSLKFSHFKWKSNEVRYILLLVSIVLFFFVREQIFLYIIPLYVLLSALVGRRIYSK